MSGSVPNRHISSGDPGDSCTSDEVTSDEEALRRLSIQRRTEAGVLMDS
jgi:hypothetical protein